jgi:ketosteroid isomerase-like protein
MDRLIQNLRVGVRTPRRTPGFAATVTVALTLGCAALSSRPPARRGEATVRAIEQRRFEAMTTRDLRALDTLLADDLRYTHTTGKVDTKASLLDDLRAGRLVYESITPGELHVHVHGDAATLAGTARMQVRANDVAQRFSIRFTETYVNRGGRWQLVAWQSTRLLEP